MLVLYRIYQVFIMLPLLVVVTILAAVVTVAGCALGGGKWWGYYPAALWGRIICWISFVRVTVSGRGNISRSTSYVFVANHQGAYDIFSIYGYLRHNFRWMMKASLRKIPFVGYACEVSKQIYVDKSSATALKHTMERAEQMLSNGMSIVVFPEGARTYTGKVGSFKRGAFSLAQEFRLPIVPITIDGAYKVLPRTSKWPHWGHIHLTIHKPIVPDSAEGHDMPKAMAQSREAILSALPENLRD
jgi:hypothetical protein